MASDLATIYGRLHFARQCGGPITRVGEETESARAALHAAIDALAALAQPAPTAEVALPAVSEETPHLATVRDKLIRAGARLPMENKGTIESAMAGGLSIALAVIEAEIEAVRAKSAASDEAENSFDAWVDDYPCQIIGNIYDYCRDAFNAGRKSAAKGDAP